MSFTYPALAVAGAFLALVPIVIHLLNRRRRRQVAWAAMDFLLTSDRKNRTWVRLSEWLLLAARVAAIALVGLLAATPTALDLVEGFFGAQRARHVVLLDDTCSMQRRDAGGAAWDEAIESLGRLADSVRQSGDELVVVRQLDTLTGAEPATVVGQHGGGAHADPKAWRPTNAVGDPTAALDRLQVLCDNAPDGAQTYAYVFSDFAESSYGPQTEWGPVLKRLGGHTDGVVLAACGEPAGGNVALESLSLAPGPLAAGVESRLRAELVNHSPEPSVALSLTLRRNGQPLTAVQVDPLEPGERRVVEAPVTFLGVGVHTLEASLPEDRLPADDRCWLGVDTPAAQPVVLVDNHPQAIESRVFAAALRPIGSTRSGWAPVRVASLSDESLADAPVVMVLDVERLSDVDVSRLREHVASGGGLLMVLGPRTDPAWFNRSIAGALGDGQPLTPWRLGPVTSVPPVALGSPLLEAADHAAVRVFTGTENGFLPLVRWIAQRRLVEDNTPRLRQVSTVETPRFAALLSRVDGAPLLVESRYGAGRVAALLTSVATGTGNSGPWSNLASLPVFPVLVNDLTGWLASERLHVVSEPIGRPSVGAAPPRSRLLAWRSDSPLSEASSLGGAASLAPAEPGVYRRAIGGVEMPVFAARIDPAESDLRAATLGVLRERWGDVARIGRANALFRDTPTPSDRGPLYAVCAATLGLLAAERLLAYRNSYVRAATPRRTA